MRRPQARRRAPPAIKSTVLRQFDGGWNVIDNELNLAPRYARIFDNVMRAPDGSVQVRYGYKLFKDGATGTITAFSGQSVTFTTTSGSGELTVNWTAHGFSANEHITITALSGGDVNGLDDAEIIASHGVEPVNANSFKIQLRDTASSTGTTGARTISGQKDTNLIVGDILNIAYFKGHIVIATSLGELLYVDYDDQELLPLWNAFIANLDVGSPQPWRACDFVNFAVGNNTLIAFNGVDKPLEITADEDADTLSCGYLADPATNSNAAVPVGSFGMSSSQYFMVGGVPGDLTTVYFAAEGTTSVYVGNAAPDDAVNVDMSRVTNTQDPTVRGFAELRDRVVVAYRDACSLGLLGAQEEIGVGTFIHDPDFKDSIPQHGTISQRTIVALGNDILMCDRVGVPSLALSQVSGAFVPSRVSNLIEPEMQRIISRLSEPFQTLHVFAVYNPRDRQYMVLMPKYEDGATTPMDAIASPITIFAVDGVFNHFRIMASDHGMERGDTFTITGLTGSIGSVAASTLHGVTWTVKAVPDYRTIIVEASASLGVSVESSGGGTAGVVNPINDETLGFIYTYNPELRIRAWSRFRGLDFDAGCATADGRVIFAKGTKLYLYGSAQTPYYADALDDYDVYNWPGATTITAGQRYRNSANSKSYTCLTTHTGSASLAADLTANPSMWEEFEGYPIAWEWELPWGDFDVRMYTKAFRNAHPDAEGTGSFSLQLFTDNNYLDPTSGDLIPARELEFVGQQGSGLRTTKDQLLWLFPVYAKLLKLRFVGETTEPLRILAVSLLYHEGNVAA